mmetsp:Transcript_136690/g.262707  ORF Transcript_136690/g.262707 Transcript_136690/m.262707 type:complete len:287 (-) Transcript_136690:205-1065(-)
MAKETSASCWKELVHSLHAAQRAYVLSRRLLPKRTLHLAPILPAAAELAHDRPRRLCRLRSPTHLCSWHRGRGRSRRPRRCRCLGGHGSHRGLQLRHRRGRLLRSWRSSLLRSWPLRLRPLRRGRLSRGIPLRRGRLFRGILSEKGRHSLEAVLHCLPLCIEGTLGGQVIIVISRVKASVIFRLQIRLHILPQIIVHSRLCISQFRSFLVQFVFTVLDVPGPLLSQCDHILFVIHLLFLFVIHLLFLLEWPITQCISTLGLVSAICLCENDTFEECASSVDELLAV